MEEHAPGKGDAEAGKDFRVEQGQQHHLLERLHVALQSADLTPVHTAINRHRLHIASACHPTRIEAASTSISAAAATAAAIFWVAKDVTRQGVHGAPNTTGP